MLTHARTGHACKHGTLMRKLLTNKFSLKSKYLWKAIIPLLLAADRKDPAFRPLGQYWCKVFRWSLKLELCNVQSGAFVLDSVTFLDLAQVQSSISPWAFLPIVIYCSSNWYNCDSFSNYVSFRHLELCHMVETNIPKIPCTARNSNHLENNLVWHSRKKKNFIF